eukprot:s4471_g2.t1
MEPQISWLSPSHRMSYLHSAWWRTSILGQIQILRIPTEQLLSSMPSGRLFEDQSRKMWFQMSAQQMFMATGYRGGIAKTYLPVPWEAMLLGLPKPSSKDSKCTRGTKGGGREEPSSEDEETFSMAKFQPVRAKMGPSSGSNLRVTWRQA